MTTACIKGTGMIGIVKALRSRREVAKDHLPRNLHYYLTDRILVGSWYPERDYLNLLKAYRQVWPERTWEEIGRFGAREGLQGVYRNIIQGDIAASVQRMRANWRNYHNTGELISEIDSHVIRVRVCNYELVAKEACLLNQGYFTELLMLSGADIIRSRKVRCTADGDNECLWEFDKR